MGIPIVPQIYIYAGSNEYNNSGSAQKLVTDDQDDLDNVWISQEGHPDIVAQYV